MWTRARQWLTEPVSPAPLATFRVVTGLLLLFSTLRFMALGWIDDHYIEPVFHFKYYGFSWVEPLPATGMYAVHGLLALSSLLVALGLFYRIAAVLQFVLFTYTELIDLTYYLNHYYFVSLVCFLLILAPAHRSFSLDVWRRPGLAASGVPRWSVFIFKAQLAIVYTYAGLWKMNADWLLHALPLKIWVPANDKLPLIGPLMTWKITPYLFSWAGMLYDTTIVWWLSWRKTRLAAYVTVILFHLITGMMFQIGVFPLVMMGATLIFFSETWHRRWQRALWPGQPAGAGMYRAPNWAVPTLALYLLFQVLFPWRYLLYPGNVFWTEEGYRFSWRVMLMEKAGTATFYVRDGQTGREGEVVNSEFLNAHQEKQMAMQPDMILQFAQFLKKHYAQKGVIAPEVRAEIYVTLNGRPSRLYLDPDIDLSTLEDGWSAKKWILPYEK